MYDADMFRFELLDQARIYIAECESYTRPIVDQKFDSPWERYDVLFCYLIFRCTRIQVEL
jgi:hypothetical protein